MPLAHLKHNTHTHNTNPTQQRNANRPSQHPIPPSTKATSPAHEKIIVALDYPSVDEAQTIVDLLGDSISIYKLGLELLMSGDFFPFIDQLKTSNKKVFADIKFFDIPETVSRAVRNLSASVDFLTVHGDRSIMQAACDARTSSRHPMQILAVTVLTTLDNESIQSFGVQCTVQDLVKQRAQEAQAAGCDGIIASGRELSALRKLLGDDFTIITPGIRPQGRTIPKDDQKRTVTPEEAIRNGATHIVVGRPITKAKNPKQVVEDIQNSIKTLT